MEGKDLTKEEIWYDAPVQAMDFVDSSTSNKKGGGGWPGITTWAK